MGSEVAPRAFEFKAWFPTDKQPYKPDGMDGGTVVLSVPESDWYGIPDLHRVAKGHELRVLVEVLPTQVVGKKQK